MSWSDAILCQGSGMLLLLALRKPNCNSCAALTLLFCLFSLLFRLCCARHEEMAWGSSCYRKWFVCSRAVKLLPSAEANAEISQDSSEKNVIYLWL